MVNTPHFDLDIDSTLGGNNASDYVIPSQKAIKDYVDNTTGSTVDQTYDPTSQAAQSGVAIAGAGFIKNVASGTDCIGILGVTSSESIRSISIGKNSHAEGTGAISICSPAGSNFNLGAYADGAIQIGVGKNTNANTFQVGNYQLLDENGIIPDVRISKQTTLSSSSTDIQIPSAKCVYDNLLLKADTTLSNVSSINANSAVQTALDGKADTSLLNLNSTGQAVLDGKVSKSGDTMTGNLNVSKSNPQIYLINTDMELGVTPSENFLSNLRFIDKNETNLGSCYFRQQSSGTTDINLNCINPSGGSAAILRVGFNADGEAYSIFPNTYRCDGQWIAKAQTICNGRTSETSNKNWTLNLPNDSYNYEVILVGAVTTGTTSGNQARIILNSSIITGNVYICNAQTRTSSNITTYASVIFPIGSNHTLTVVGWGSNTGAYSLYLCGYRRIGTNS